MCQSLCCMVNQLKKAIIIADWMMEDLIVTVHEGSGSIAPGFLSDPGWLRGRE